jgi:hypothetical protein
MNYQGQLQTGEKILLQNDGEQTHIQLQSGDEGKRESQGSGFETGKWKKTPTLFSSGEGAVLRIEGSDGEAFVEITGHGINRLSEAPNLDGAEEIELSETDEELAEMHMKPMAPMKPMKPLF